MEKRKEINQKSFFLFYTDCNKLQDTQFYIFIWAKNMCRVNKSLEVLKLLLSTFIVINRSLIAIS